MLQEFLGKQKACIRGSPEDYFCHWLWILGIVNLDDPNNANPPVNTEKHHTFLL